MIAFKINGEFLDLLPGTQLELEEENPLLQFNDEVKGSHSFPFDIPITEKNARILGFTHRTQAAGVDKYDAICYDNDLQHSVGYVKIENIKSNLNAYKSGRISCYYLISSSYFFQDVKDKKLSHLLWGGERSFPNPIEVVPPGGRFPQLAANTFWGHIKDCAYGTVNQFDYTFFPIQNNSMITKTDRQAKYMNAWTYRNNVTPQFSVWTPITDSLNFAIYNTVFPAIYLSYMIREIFKEVDWAIDGEVLDDPDFNKVVVQSFRDISWRYGVGFDWPDTVEFSLKDHVPDVTIAEFIIAVKNRFGMVFTFDKGKKSCRVTWLKSYVHGESVDITSYCLPQIEVVSEERKVYSLKQTGEYSSEILKLEGYKGTVPHYSWLSLNPNQSMEGWIYFVPERNAFYICRQEEEGSPYAWHKYLDNNFHFLQDGETGEISTSSSICNMEWDQYHFVQNPWQGARFDINGIFPKIDRGVTMRIINDNEFPWGIWFLFYHGIRKSANGKDYPFASSVPADPNNNNGSQLIGQWALPFKYIARDGEDRGIYETFYRKFLETLDSGKKVKAAAHMPWRIFNQLQFGQTAIIDHTKFYLIKKSSHIPYSGGVTLELLKI